MFGFDGLALIDHGLEHHARLIAAVGNVLFRLSCGIAVLICALCVYIIIRDQTAVWRRGRGQRSVAAGSADAPMG